MLPSYYNTAADPQAKQLTDLEHPHHALAPSIPLPLLGLGLLLFVTFVAARSVGDLLAYFPLFLLLFVIAFAAYLAACAYILREQPASRYSLAIILAFAIGFRLVQVFAQPALSSDLYRYVWDGRVQRAGINPYLHAPEEPALIGLRDRQIYPYINRKAFISVYPPGGELIFRAAGWLAPDSLTGIQAIMALGDIIALCLLVALLRHRGLPPERVILYAWSPLLVYELANNAHLEGMMLPFLIAALLAQQRGQTTWAGICLGIATQIKIYPAVLMAVLWRRWDWRMLLAFVLTVLLAFLPYLDAGPQIFSYLPTYANEQFDMSLAIIGYGLLHLGVSQGWRIAQGIQVLGLATLGLYFIWKPSQHPETIFWRCLALIGWITVWTLFFQPWYVLWVLPFLTLLWRRGRWLGMGPTAVIAWLLFTGSAALSYYFYWQPDTFIPVVFLEYLPLYLFLALSVRELRTRTL